MNPITNKNSQRGWQTEKRFSPYSFKTSVLDPSGIPDFTRGKVLSTGSVVGGNRKRGLMVHRTLGHVSFFPIQGRKQYGGKDHQIWPCPHSLPSKDHPPCVRSHFPFLLEKNRRQRFFNVEFSQLHPGLEISHRSLLSLIGTCLLLLGLAIPSHAQSITSDGSSIGTMVNQAGSTWEISGGTRPGGAATLYHSFGNFSVPANNTALFLNNPAAAATNNILARVTGGNVSSIFGTIDSATNFPGAELFLMNPAGFIFGANATLNVGGAFTATTANNIEMDDASSTVFNAVPNAGADALLVTASVEAFGFLGGATPIMVAGSNAAIEIQGLNSGGSSVTFVGRDAVAGAGGPVVEGVEVNGTITTAGGNVTIGSVDSPGRAIPGSIDLSDFSKKGQVALSGTINANGTTTNPNGGDVEIQGRTIEGNNVSITTDPPLTPPFVDPATDGVGGNVTITGDENVYFTNSDISSTSRFALGSGTVTIQSNVNDGSISLVNTDVQSEVVSSTGNGGGITVAANTVHIQGGTISTLADGTPMGLPGPPPPFGPPPPTPANAGPLTIKGNFVTFSDGVVINSSTTGPGNAGPTTVTGVASPAKVITISGDSEFRNNTTGTGNGAKTLLDGNIVKIIENSILSSRTATSSGNGGEISVVAQDITVDASEITSEAIGGTGNPGEINFTSLGDTNVANGARFSATSTTNSDAGDLNFTTTGGSLFFTQAQLETSAPNANGGNIKFTAPPGGNIFLNGTTINGNVGGGLGANISFDPGFIAIKQSVITATAGAGTGGTISLTASFGIFVDQFSTLDASAGPAGISGEVNVSAPIQNLNGVLTPLPQSIVKVANLYAERCAAQKGGKFNSFVQGGREGLPPSPGGFMPSPLQLNSLPSIGAMENESLGVSVTAKRLGFGGFLEQLGLNHKKGVIFNSELRSCSA